MFHCCKDDFTQQRWATKANITQQCQALMATIPSEEILLLMFALRALYGKLWSFQDPSVFACR